LPDVVFKPYLAHTCNPSFSEGEGPEDHGPKPALGKKKKKKKKKENMKNKRK
jgi:hypothetical protein